VHQFDVKMPSFVEKLKQKSTWTYPQDTWTYFCQHCVTKALYGLKQSSQVWFGRFTRVMVGLGFKKSQGDNNFFYWTLWARECVLYICYNLRGSVENVLQLDQDLCNYPIYFAMTSCSYFYGKGFWLFCLVCL
jgi:hypothetical protein